MDTEATWEEAFTTLDKRVFSADAIGGYDFIPLLDPHVTKESRILDFGCGKGQMVSHLKRIGFPMTFGTDPSPKLLNSSQDTFSLKVMENGKIPFEDSSFDLVFCSGVLHHINWMQIPMALGEIRRVLKNQGIFLYAEPRKTWMRSVGHILIMSPLNVISSNARALSDCLHAEWPTYDPWLRKQHREFLPMCESFGFKPITIVQKAMTVIGTLRLHK